MVKYLLYDKIISKIDINYVLNLISEKKFEITSPLAPMTNLFELFGN